MIFKLNLPPLPLELISRIRLISNLTAHNNDSRVWLNEFHDNKVNSANHSFELTPDDINNDINQIYKSYFGEDMFSIIGVIRNVTDRPACLPPHCDRYRNVAINFLIDEGGSNVSTCFYDYTKNPTITLAENVKHDNINLIDTQFFKSGNWYAHNVQQCHSVENIETTRIFLGVVLKSNPSIDSIMGRLLQYSNKQNEHA